MTHRHDPEQLRAERISIVSALRDSDAFFKVARFAEALKVVQSIQQTAFHPAHAECWQAQLLAQEARLRYHVRDLAGMQNCLAQISASQRAVDPLLDALCFQVEGHFARLRAVSARERGDDHAARELMGSAIASFGTAATAAAMAPDAGLAMWNSRLNAVYAKGFIASIDDVTATANRYLTATAVVIETEIQRATPSSQYSALPGLLIVADLAHGAGLSVADVHELVVAGQIPDLHRSYVSCCAQVLGRCDQSWHDLLLTRVREYVDFGSIADTSLRPWQLAQTLIFAAKLARAEPDMRARQQRAIELMPHMEFAKFRCAHIQPLCEALEKAAVDLARRSGLSRSRHSILR